MGVSHSKQGRVKGDQILSLIDTHLSSCFVSPWQRVSSHVSQWTMWASQRCGPCSCGSVFQWSQTSSWESCKISVNVYLDNKTANGCLFFQKTKVTARTNFFLVEVWEQQYDCRVSCNSGLKHILTSFQVKYLLLAQVITHPLTWHPLCQRENLSSINAGGSF